ncbi:SDR family NAD(P)-dependent oxidoreductase [Piscicoccus intestinalis]|uniref:SDR family NAD(P)-dependent oxidoreductase n=1 Tax=Piscicoccus intestinalis TaxID=746033 RepID=UPI000AAEF694|nr:SDR family oxidoreductase [Piscicoccus intestinalis]
MATARCGCAAAGRLSTHELDVTDSAAVRALPETVTAAHGQVDGLLNVAGIIQPFVRLVDLDEEHVRRVMAVNFDGVLTTVRAFLPGLLTRPEAAIVNVSSMGGLAPVPGQTVYGASKAAVGLLTEGLYAELRGTSVTVTAVYPGGVATGISENSGVRMAGRETAPSAAQQRMLTSAPAAARQIVDGMVAGRYRVLVGWDARAVDLLSRLAPRFATELIARQMARLLDPAPEPAAAVSPPRP